MSTRQQQLLDYLAELQELTLDDTTRPEAVIKKIDEGIQKFIAVGVDEKELMKLYEARANTVVHMHKLQESELELKILKETALSDYLREYMFEKEAQA